MIKIENYTTEEQKAYLQRMAEIDRNEMGLNAHYDMMKINGANCQYEINQAKARIQEDGLGYIDRKTENTEWRINDVKQQIEALQKQLAEYEETMELIKKLKTSGWDDILDKMCEDREKELEAIEYMEYWDIDKTRKSTGWGVNDYKVQIRATKWRVEKGNWNNKCRIYGDFILDWKERAELINELKDREAENLVVHKDLQTKKLASEFMIWNQM